MNELKILKHLAEILLNEQTNYRLTDINRTKNYFESEIREQREIIRRLSKYITGLYCADKILTGFLTKFSRVNIFSHIKDKKISGLVTSIFSLISCISIGIIKKLKKHNKIFYFGKNKADSVEMLISQAIIDLDISHEGFKTIINEKKDYDSQKNIINEDDKGKISKEMLV